ncbi:MAG: M14 family zinc carboxypeptidase [Oceanihabitans sp.]
MLLKTLKQLLVLHKETSLKNRYIHSKSILPYLHNKCIICRVAEIGESVNGEKINSITIGTGPKKVLMWSQMHGNESTSTKAIFDLLNTLQAKNSVAASILEACTIKIIPILNPDGALAYTRLNANQVDLNRDAQELTQPETKALIDCYKSFKPHFCYNLHGQRTIFSAGNNNKTASVSFLAPAQDKACTITKNRKQAMELIAAMYAVLQKQIPNQVAVYDDTFNINCVGDTFQHFGVPTMLFEAGHVHNDYNREMVREYIYQSLVVSLSYIANKQVTGAGYKPYLKIPENKKCFFDIIIRNAKVAGNIVDVAVQYEEQLKDGKIDFVPKIARMELLSNYFAHKTIQAHEYEVVNKQGEELVINQTLNYLLINNEEYSLKLR